MLHSDHETFRIITGKFLLRLVAEERLEEIENGISTPIPENDFWMQMEKEIGESLEI